MSIPAAVICEPQVPPCCEGAPAFYGQGKTYLSAQTGFLLTCPPGFSCDAGAYPHNIVVPGGSIPFTPPVGENPLRINCCDGTVEVRYLPDGFTQAQFDTAAQALADFAATKLADCMAADYNAANAHPRLRFTTTTPPVVCGGDDYSFALTVEGGVAPYTFTQTGGALPPGITLSTDGLLSGNTVTAGFYVSQIKAVDVRGNSANSNISLRVAVITNVFVAPVSPGVAYIDQLFALGTTLPETWTIISGALPDGLSLNASTGDITGTPDHTDTDNRTVTFQLVDSSDPPALCTRALDFNWFCDGEKTNVIDLTWGNVGNGTAAITGGNGTFSYAAGSGLTGPRMLSDQLCVDFSYPLVVTLNFNASGIRAPSAFDLQFDLRYDGVVVDTMQVGGGAAGPWALSGPVTLTFPLPQTATTQIRIDITFQGLTTSITGTYEVRPLIRPA